MERLSTNINQIHKKIQETNRPVNLVAVTKNVDSQMVRNLYQAGLTKFGENRTKSLIEKQNDLSDLQTEIEWHFIGNLQSRQVKSVINQIDYLHSLDRLSLAKEIQKRAEKTIKCFVQVNVSGEESKSGFEADDLLEQIESLKVYDKIEVIGLMTMAPLEATEEEIQGYFAHLKQLQQQIAQQKYTHAPCTELSMGMTQDYQIALEEGATYIRIGTALYDGVTLD